MLVADLVVGLKRSLASRLFVWAMVAVGLVVVGMDWVHSGGAAWVAMAVVG